MKIKIIERAIENKDRVFAKYHGGSHCGKARELGPISIDNDTGKVRARCYNTNIVKTFMVEKIELIDQQCFEATKLVPKLDPLPELNSLQEVFEYYKDTLESMGWGVSCNSSLGVHGFFKNGKMKPGKAVSISFFLQLDGKVYEDPNDINLDLVPINKRPWSVRAKGLKPASFHHINAAAKKFMDFVFEIEPTGSAPKKQIESDLSKLSEVGLIEHIIKTRVSKKKETFDRLKEHLVVPEVSYDRKTMTGDLNNSHWKFKVGYAFRDALDLMYQQRVENKKNVQVWTQGPIIAFKEGDTFESRTGVSLQVKNAAPMGWDEVKNEMYYGLVRYQAYAPLLRSYSDTYTCNQLEFLDILIGNREFHSGT
ncbi:hypothetical protein L3Q72_06575 [Vibrio sp. JC009]|uniref:hypothetical protein n=1 Tax=Vibrio sp. JC009 TaxID=2912314 RepID=UPI0023B101BE|nr:hypothetical protein [Vibrio sp. JC009]WED23054.1 hypothetical protein L3Q72_06575 [Vibrio sp. JC009]